MGTSSSSLTWLHVLVTQQVSDLFGASFLFLPVLLGQTSCVDRGAGSWTQELGY